MIIVFIYIHNLQSKESVYLYLLDKKICWELLMYRGFNSKRLNQILIFLFGKKEAHNNLILTFLHFK